MCWCTSICLHVAFISCYRFSSHSEWVHSHFNVGSILIFLLFRFLISTFYLLLFHRKSISCNSESYRIPFFFLLFSHLWFSHFSPDVSFPFIGMTSSSAEWREKIDRNGLYVLVCRALNGHSNSYKDIENITYFAFGKCNSSPYTNRCCFPETASEHFVRRCQMRKKTERNDGNWHEYNININGRRKIRTKKRRKI